MKYLKHYWICVNDNKYCCLENPTEKRHPEAEFPGLDVKIWLHDEDGIDVCLSVVPDTTEVSDIIDETYNKKVVQVLTEEEFNSVSVPYFAAQQLQSQLLNENGEENVEIRDEISEQISLCNQALFSL